MLPMTESQRPLNAPSKPLQQLRNAFHAYARWLVSISWKRFFLLVILLYICVNILAGVAPFHWEIPPPSSQTSRNGDSGQLEHNSKVEIRGPQGVIISIDEHGIRIHDHSEPAKPDSQDAPESEQQNGEPVVPTPPSANDAKTASSTQEGSTETEPKPDAHKQVQIKVMDNTSGPGEPFRLGDLLLDLTHLFVFSSIILKLVYKGQMQAEAVAHQAHAQAEAEQLRRQLAEARMATLQAQIEPHFLFNTLASIEHLIQSDPPKARLMQQHLIALLRASMPDWREAVERPLRPLARELEMVRPYLAIQKIRMEERLEVQLDIPDGLLSAEFPPLMLQTLVENAIRHGLEPQPSGGTLQVRAEVRDGQLFVHVIDNGAGLLASRARAGTGTGLDNVRERLRLHYGAQAGLDLQARTEGGTQARLHLPYRVAITSTEGARA